MSVTFPSIKPSARTYKMGAYPIKVYRALSGATVKRSFGNRPTGYQLDLRFERVSDATVNLILDHYTTTGGGFNRFTVPDALFAGMTDSLRGRIQAPTGVKWEYADAPRLESVFPGLSNVSVSLLGEQVVR